MTGQIKALLLTTGFVNFFILVTYQLFYSSDQQAVRFQANLNFAPNIGQNSIVHKGTLKGGRKKIDELPVEAQIDLVEEQQEAIENVEEFLGQYLDQMSEERQSENKMMNQEICGQSNKHLKEDAFKSYSVLTDTDQDFDDYATTRSEIDNPANYSLYWMNNPKYHNHYIMGKNFLCDYQKYNHIPALNTDWERIQLVFKKYYAKQPSQCLSGVYPTLLEMKVLEQCQQLFKEEPAQITILTGEQQLMTKELRKRLLWKYKDGTKCGEIEDELLLMVGEKSVLNIDVYVLISSTKPLIVYSTEMLDQDKKLTHKELVLKLENYTKDDSQIFKIKDNIKKFIVEFGRAIENSVLKDHRVFELIKLTFKVSDKIKTTLYQIESVSKPPSFILSEVLKIIREYQINLLQQESPFQNRGVVETDILNKIVDYSGEDQFMGMVEKECL